MKKETINETVLTVCDSYNLYPATTTDPLSHTTYQEHDYSSGKVTKIIDQNGRVFTTTYDGLDRPIEDKQPDLTTPSTLITKATYTYTDTGVPTSVHKTDTSAPTRMLARGMQILTQSRRSGQRLHTPTTTVAISRR